MTGAGDLKAAKRCCSLYKVMYTANSNLRRHGGRGRSAWRSIVSILVAAMVLFSSAHHLLCATDDEIPGAAASIVLSGNDQAAPVHDSAVLPGDCHCVCHSTAEAKIVLAAAPVEFASTAYGTHTEHSPPPAAEMQPFKPPRA
jgi:hypothetical protein